MESAWWVYVLECEGGVLYTGIAKDVQRRFDDHQRGRAAHFTRRNRPVRILASAAANDRGTALRVEYAFKRLSRTAKLSWCTRGLEHFVAERAGHGDGPPRESR